MTNPIWVIKTRLCLQYTGSPAGVTQTPQYKGMIGKKKGNLADLTLAKTYGTVAKDRKKYYWLIADWRVPNNDPKNNCRTHFGSSSLVVCQTGRFTGWVNGLKNSCPVNFIPGSCLLFVLQIRAQLFERRLALTQG